MSNVDAITAVRARVSWIDPRVLEALLSLAIEMALRAARVRSSARC